MGRVIEFLQRFGNIGLFLLLQFIAFLLIVNRNDHQRKVFKSVSLVASGNIYQVRSGITQYFHLNTQNEFLQDENDSLRKQVLNLREHLAEYEYRIPLSTDYTLLPDSVLPSAGYEFIACKTIKTSTNGNYNYITLNKGYKQGVMDGMGLISPKGVAGRIIAVSGNYSLALSVLNKKFKLSAKLQANNNVGTLSWNGEDPRIGILDFIPETATVTIGDQVVTSGYSTIFPERFLVGVVKDYHKESNSGFYTIRVELATDFSALGNLYLVNHTKKEESDSLELNLPK